MTNFDNAKNARFVLVHGMMLRMQYTCEEYFEALDEDTGDEYIFWLSDHNPEDFTFYKLEEMSK